jgi:hypothetical protein
MDVLPSSYDSPKSSKRKRLHEEEDAEDMALFRRIRIKATVELPIGDSHNTFPASDLDAEMSRGRRTIGVRELADGLKSEELMAFFEQVGPVNGASIVKSQASGIPKGYVLLFYID